MKTIALILARGGSKEIPKKNIQLLSGEPLISYVINSAKWSEVDEVWVTIASESTVLRRLQGKVGLSQQQSLARIRSQLSSEERMKHADVVIDTDCSLDELKAKVKELWENLHTSGVEEASI